MESPRGQITRQGSKGGPNRGARASVCFQDDAVSMFEEKKMGGDRRVSFAHNNPTMRTSHQDVVRRPSQALVDQLRRPSAMSLMEQSAHPHMQSTVMQFFEKALDDAARMVKEWEASDEANEDDEDGKPEEGLEPWRVQLMQGNRIVHLANLLSTKTFSLSDERIDGIIGHEVTQSVREAVVQAVMRATEALWERVSERLLMKYGNFERAFVALDEDGSGALDRDEFVKSYADIFKGTDDETASLGSGRRLSQLANQEMYKDMQSAASLRVDAELLFDMLKTQEAGLGDEKKGDDDSDEEGESVSMRDLILRLTGMGQRAMERLREQILKRFPNLKGAFEEFAKRGDELSFEEFFEMFIKIGLAEDEENSSSKVDAELEARKAFNAIDVDGGGTVSMLEMQRALASVAPHTAFSVFRRRLLLQYGSFDKFFASQARGRTWTSEEELESFAFSFDLNVHDARSFGRLLGFLVEKDSEGSVLVNQDGRVTTEGYTIEEFAINLFFSKSEENSIEDLFSKLPNFDRDKNMPLAEFSDRIFGQKGTGIGELGMSVVFENRSGSPTENALGLVNMRKRDLAADALKLDEVVAAKKIGKDLKRKTAVNTVQSTLPVKCALQEIICLYEALQREHERVSANILQRSLTNISDILAADRRAYQPGERAIVRFRLSPEARNKSLACPIVALVPQQLVYKAEGQKEGRWLMDNVTVTDIKTVALQCAEIPREKGGSPKREGHIYFSVPFLLAPNERFEFRAFASANGKTPGKQLGQGVPFEILVPGPSKPVVDRVQLDSETEEGSVVLRWSPPNGDFSVAPVTDYVVKIEPMIYKHEQAVDRSKNDQAFEEISVWSPAKKGMDKKLSYRIDGLKRGVEYRFGIQALHMDMASQTQAQFRGAVSDLSELVVMPSYLTTDAPGMPTVVVGKNYEVELAWQAPQDEGLSDLNKIFDYEIQYRSIDNEDDEEGWTSITERFVSRPRWEDFVGWVIDCKAYQVVPLRGDDDESEHEFRVCAITLAGLSPFSDPSDPQQLFQSKGHDPPPPVENLLAAEVFCEEQEAGSRLRRRYARLEWNAPFTNGAEVLHVEKYTALVKEPRGHDEWTNMDIWFRGSATSQKGVVPRASLREQQGGQRIEAVCFGLDRFPVDEPVAMKILAWNANGSSESEIILPPVEQPKAPRPPLAPTVLQVLPADGFHWVELKWRAPERVTMALDYQLNVAKAPKPTGVYDAPKFESWEAIEAWTRPQKLEGFVSCWVRGLSPLEQVYTFRVCTVGSSGPGEWSPASAALNWVPPKHKQGKPRGVEIVRTDHSWCELTFDQVISEGSIPPALYSVQESREGWGEPNWRPIQNSYVAVENHAELRTVRAVCFFNEEGDRRQRWRVRVRAGGDGAEWSAPTHWHDPFVAKLPSRPSPPAVLHVSSTNCRLEWKMPPESQEAPHDFELQVQTHQPLKGFSEWSRVRPYCTAPGVNGMVGAIMEMKDAEETILNAMMTNSGTTSLRFRVRALAMGGAAGPVSEPSAPVASKPTLRHNLAPSAPEIMERWAAESVEAKQIGAWWGTRQRAELARVQWPLLSPPDRTDPQNSIFTYELEMEDEEGTWSKAEDAMINLDWEACRATAFVRLPYTLQPRSQRLRVVAQYGSGSGLPSEPSQTLLWGQPPILEVAPDITSITQQQCEFSFCMPTHVRQFVKALNCNLEMLEESDESDESDEEGDEMEEMLRIVEVGVFPVLWREIDAETQMCHGVAILPDDVDFKAGDKIRARLQCITVDGPIGNPTDPSEPAIVEATQTEPANNPAHKKRPSVNRHKYGSNGQTASLLVEYPHSTPILPMEEQICWDPTVYWIDNVTGTTYEWDGPGDEDDHDQPKLCFALERGVMPEGLTLDEDTGSIQGICMEFETFDSFTISCSVEEDWDNMDSLQLYEGMVATVTLGCAVIEDAVCELFSDEVLELLHDHPEHVDAAVQAFTNENLLPVWSQLYELLSGEKAAATIARLVTMPQAWEKMASLSDEELQKLFITKHSSTDSVKFSDATEVREIIYKKTPSRRSSPVTQMEEATGTSSSNVTEDWRVGPRKAMELTANVLNSEEEERRQATQAGFGNADVNKPKKKSVAQFGEDQLITFDPASVEPDSPKDPDASKKETFSVSQCPHCGGGLSMNAAAAPARHSMRRATHSSKGLSSEENEKPRRKSLAKQAQPVQEIESSQRLSTGDPSDISRSWQNAEEQLGVRMRKESMSERKASLSAAKAQDESSRAQDESSSLEKSRTVKRRSSAMSKLSTGDIDLGAGQSGEKAIPSGQKETSSKLARRKSQLSVADSAAAGIPNMGRRRSRAAGAQNFVKPIPAAAAEEEEAAAVPQRERTSVKHAKIDSESLVMPSQLLPPTVTITYPRLTPFWGAFEDIEFTPEIKCVDGNTGETIEPPALTFEISPLLPTQVHLDRDTGLISGSPLLPYVAGAQYTVTVRLAENSEKIGYCALAFAVLPGEIAAACNNAWLAQEPPAFRPPSCRPGTREKATAGLGDIDATPPPTANWVPLPAPGEQTPNPPVVKHVRPLGTTLRDRPSSQGNPQGQTLGHSGSARSLLSSTGSVRPASQGNPQGQTLGHSESARSLLSSGGSVSGNSQTGQAMLSFSRPTSKGNVTMLGLGSIRPGSSGTGSGIISGVLGVLDDEIPINIMRQGQADDTAMPWSQLTAACETSPFSNLQDCNPAQETSVICNQAAGQQTNITSAQNRRAEQTEKKGTVLGSSLTAKIQESSRSAGPGSQAAARGAAKLLFGRSPLFGALGDSGVFLGGKKTSAGQKPWQFAGGVASRTCAGPEDAFSGKL